MCYNVKAGLEAQLRRAIRDNNQQAIEEIKVKLLPFMDNDNPVKVGFEFPKLIVNTQSLAPAFAQWGLVPSWIDETNKAKDWRNNTLNARIESLSEKNSFKNITQQRAILYVDGYYEHQHISKQKQAFFIENKLDNALAIGILLDKNEKLSNDFPFPTFSIVTQKGRGITEIIHNNPKLSEPRMPLILNELSEDIWLDTKLNIDQVQSYLEKDNKIKLKAKSTKDLSKNLDGNAQLNMFEDEVIVMED